MCLCAVPKRGEISGSARSTGRFGLLSPPAPSPCYSHCSWFYKCFRIIIIPGRQLTPETTGSFIATSGPSSDSSFQRCYCSVHGSYSEGHGKNQPDLPLPRFVI